MGVKRIYDGLENVTVEELRIDEKDLNTKRMFDLMAVNSTAGDSAPLYIAIVQRILRELRISQQQLGGGFNYTAFRQAVNNSPLLPGQKMPLEQRLETLESFMVKEQTFWDGKKKKKKFFVSPARRLGTKGMLHALPIWYRVTNLVSRLDN